MINPIYAFFRDVVVLGQNLQNMCYIIAEGHRKLATGESHRDSHWGLVLITMRRAQYSGDAKAEKGPFFTIRTLRDYSGDPRSACLILLKAAWFFAVCCWNAFQIFSPDSELVDMVKICRTILVTRWVRFSTAFCAVWSITVSSRFDILYDLSSNEQVDIKVLYIFTPIYQK